MAIQHAVYQGIVPQLLRIGLEMEEERRRREEEKALREEREWRRTERERERAERAREEAAVKHYGEWGEFDPNAQTRLALEAPRRASALLPLWQQEERERERKRERYEEERKREAGAGLVRGAAEGLAPRPEDYMGRSDDEMLYGGKLIAATPLDVSRRRAQGFAQALQEAPDAAAMEAAVRAGYSPQEALAPATLAAQRAAGERERLYAVEADRTERARKLYDEAEKRRLALEDEQRKRTEGMEDWKEQKRFEAGQPKLRELSEGQTLYEVTGGKAKPVVSATPKTSVAWDKQSPADKASTIFDGMVILNQTGDPQAALAHFVANGMSIEAAKALSGFQAPLGAVGKVEKLAAIVKASGALDIDEFIRKAKAATGETKRLYDAGMNLLAEIGADVTPKPSGVYLNGKLTEVPPAGAQGRGALPPGFQIVGEQRK